MITLFSTKNIVIKTVQKRSKGKKYRYSTQEGNEAKSKSQSYDQKTQGNTNENWSKQIEEVTKASFFSSLTSKLILGTTLAACAYQLYFGGEALEDLENVLTMLENKDPEIVLEGLNHLAVSLNTSVRVFSGKSCLEIPLDRKSAERLAVALMEIVIYGDSTNRWKALSWISLFSSSVPAVRDILAKEYSEDLADVALNTNRLENTNNEWVIGSNILLNLMKDQASFSKINPEVYTYCINTFSDRANQPVAVIVSSQMANFVGGEVIDKNLSGEIGAKMLKQCIDESVAPTLQPEVNTGANLTSIFVVSLFASGWSSLRWGLRLSSKGIVGTKAFGFLRNLQTGRLLFTALIADLALQRVLRFASTEKFEFDLERVKASESNVLEGDVLLKPAEKVNEFLQMVPLSLPLSNVAPVFQNALFGCTILALHVRRRYILLPLLGALAYNHQDYLKHTHAYDYVQDVYKMISDKK